MYENLLANGNEETPILVDNGFGHPLSLADGRLQSYLDYNMSCDEVKKGAA